MSPDYSNANLNYPSKTIYKLEEEYFTSNPPITISSILGVPVFLAGSYGTWLYTQNTWIAALPFTLALTFAFMLVQRIRMGKIAK